MFVKYGKGREGIEKYLLDGQKKDRFFTRDQLDSRLILSGNLDDLSGVLKSYSKSTTTGDNYKHFVLTFKENFIPDNILSSINSDFKRFITSGYKSDELYYYAEAHQPKILGFVTKNQQLTQRKPHIHCIIPVYNLITGNKGFNFNYHTHDFEKYLRLFSRYINNKYGLQSPFVLENKKLLSIPSEQISRHSTKDFGSLNNFIKKNLLQDIIENNTSTLQELHKLITNEYSKKYNLSVKFGDKNSGLIILTNNKNKKEIPLKDFCFTYDFLSLSKTQKSFLFEKFNNRYTNDLSGSDFSTPENFTTEDKKELAKWYKNVAKLLKYSKTTAHLSSIIENKSVDEQTKILNTEEYQFYAKHRTPNIDKIIRRISENTKLAESNIRGIQATNQIINANTRRVSRNIRTFKRLEKRNNSINFIDSKTFISLIELKFGLCIHQIKNTKNGMMYKNKLYINNDDLLKCLPISKYMRSKFKTLLLNKKCEIEELSKINKNAVKLNFYQDKFQNKFSENIRKEYLSFTTQSHTNQVELVYETMFNHFSSLKVRQLKEIELQKKRDIEMAELKFINMSKQLSVEISQINKKYKDIMTDNLKQEKILKKQISNDFKSGISGDGIVENKFKTFLVYYYNKNFNNLTNQHKISIVNFLIMNNIVASKQISKFSKQLKNSIDSIICCNKINESGQGLGDGFKVNLEGVQFENNEGEYNFHLMDSQVSHKEIN